MKVFGRKDRPGPGDARVGIPWLWIAILAVAILIVLLLLSRERQQPRAPEPEDQPRDREESMGEQQTSAASEERDAPPVHDEERGLLASRWFWRGVWAFIAGLMLLLIFYEFVVLG
jgi:hypothetical protein